jgi:hypothetical protein
MSLHTSRPQVESGLPSRHSATGHTQMKITYHPDAPRGVQFDVEMESGSVVTGVPLSTVQGLATGAGKSVRQTQTLVAEAKLKAAAHAAAAAAAATRAATAQ